MTRTLLSSAIWPFTVISASAYLIAGYQLGWWIAAVISMPTLLLTGLYLLERAMPAGPGTGSHEDPERWNDIGCDVPSRSLKRNFSGPVESWPCKTPS